MTVIFLQFHLRICFLPVELVLVVTVYQSGNKYLSNTHCGQVALPGSVGNMEKDIMKSRPSRMAQSDGQARNGKGKAVAGSSPALASHFLPQKLLLTPPSSGLAPDFTGS